MEEFMVSSILLIMLVMCVIYPFGWVYYDYKTNDFWKDDSDIWK